MRWNLPQLAEATNGVISGELLGQEPVWFDLVSTDTRTLGAGALYIAIKGDNFDGHAFVAEAVKQGAVAVLVSEAMETIVPAVVVEDTRIALGQFATWHRQNKALKSLIAVTGSNGKTTTKAMLASILSQQGKTLATKGNLNNDFGVPRTLLEIDSSHEYAVVEMGANHAREIGYLTHLAKPDVAIITLAAGAHLEGFGSLQGVIDTKGEIFDGLSEDGWAIINVDSAGADQWLAKCQARGLNIKTFGQGEEADVRVSSFVQTEEGIEFQCDFDGEGHQVKMPILGRHNAMNAAAAIAACLAAGLNWAEIQPGLVVFGGVSGRLQQANLPNGCLIDDSYNANPTSVKAGIETLVAMPGDAALCLGAMAELGEESDVLHAEVAAFAKDIGAKTLFVYGEGAHGMVSVFGEGAKAFTSHDDMAQEVAELIEQNQVQNVLVKGSRSAQMEKVANQLRERFSDE